MEPNKLNRELARLKMQNQILSQKLYQVCLSHDHICAVLNRTKIPMSKTDLAMLEATQRIVDARTTEEIETIYSDMTGKLFKSYSQPSSNKGVNKIFFFNDKGMTPMSGEDLINKINKMISDIDAQIDEISKEGKSLFGDEFNNMLDDTDTPEDDLDKNDDLRPPF